MTLGNRIQEIRIQAGLSQEAFGEKIGVTRQTVSKWELDQVYPEIEKIVLISKIFKVTTDSLLIDGIDTFDVKYDSFVCGVYKSKNAEIVVTNKYTLYFYATSQHVFGVKLYQGFETNKSLIAIVERDDDLEKTKYVDLLHKNIMYIYLLQLFQNVLIYKLHKQNCHTLHQKYQCHLLIMNRLLL